MNAKELRELLADVPDDTLIVLSSDAEGNKHSPLADASNALYGAETTWSGDVYLTNEELDAEIATGDDGWSEEDRAPDDAVPAFVLVPVN